MTSEAETSPAESTSSDQDRQVKGENEYLQKQVSNYRVQRNVALRKAHAYETILNKHNIDLSQVTDEALQQLPINNGAVDGVFHYKAPDIKVPPAPAQPRTETPSVPTLDEVRKWPAEKINAHWDTVKQLLKKEK